jgi:hypothetical protein
MRYLVVLFVMGCNLPTTPSTVPDWVQAEWQIAVERLEAIGITNARAIETSRFVYVPHTSETDEFHCGAYWSSSYGDYVHGEFDKPNIIHYCDTCRSVVRHELGHAILYSLGDPWQFCWEHGELKEHGRKRFNSCPDRYLYPGRY